jgi:hypothetical protein
MVLDEVDRSAGHSAEEAWSTGRGE